MKFKHIFLLVVFSVSVLMLGGVFAQSETGAGGIGARPANPRDDNVRTNSIFVHTLGNGESVTDAINVINNSDQEKTIDVYAADSLIASGGAFSCEQKSEENDGVGGWIALDKTQVTLEANSSEIVEFSIYAPEDADVGEHNGCLVVSENKEESNNAQGIGLSFRTALRVAILVPGEITKSIEFSKVEAFTQAEEVIVTPYIKNTGNVSIDTDLSSSLKTLWGSVVSVTGGQFPVLRGEEGSWNLRHDKPFWGGWYKTSAAAGYDQNIGNFIGDTNLEERGNLSADGPIVFVLPAPLAVLAYLLFFGVIGHQAYRAIKKKRLLEREWLNHKIRTNEDLKFYQKETGVSWKKIAKINDIKAPYTLEVGKNIKLPPKKKNE